MNQHEFDRNISRLKAVYGEKVYPEDRVFLIWNKFQGLDDSDFVAAVDDLISNHRVPPMLLEIGEAIGRIRRLKPHDPSNRTYGLFDCGKCNGSGYEFHELAVDDDYRPITSRKPKADERTYSFCYRCSCEKGATESRAVPQWSGF